MHLPLLIQDLAVILGVAAVVTFIFRLIRQPVVLGYIIAGVIVGPYTPAIFSVTDTKSINIWAELGVIFLMFTLGLEFSFRRLMRVGMSAGITAFVQIFSMIVLGLLVAKMLNWGKMDAVFLGCMIAISSTTIIIKALEELNLGSKKFAELVFGILIVEDLAAILMLVALTNVATTSQIGGMELLIAALKLAIVVAAWFVVGMFVVPRFVKSVSRHGNDEMLTVVAIGLCLALVALAAKFHYSVALGAFIMGSILAESTEAKRIEHLVQPLKDIFGAVFFVSVGMLLNPTSIADQWVAITIISLIIILGKLVTVTIGAFFTGQTMSTSVQTGFSMAQIGEFSFIIGSLGLSYGVISPELYPIIVASSLVTTFTTPYLIKASGPAVSMLEQRLPTRLRDSMENYTAWVQRRTMTNDRRKAFTKGTIKWCLNAVVVIAVFTIAASKLIPFLKENFGVQKEAVAVTWVLAFLLSAPSLWAMMNSFRDAAKTAKAKRDLSVGSARLLSSMLTIGLLGLVSAEYFPARLALAVTLVVCVLLILAFRRQIGAYYRWLELQFQAGFQANLGAEGKTSIHERLAPWDAHLIDVKVPVSSKIVGKKLSELGFRERYGLNVVVISRGNIDLVAPKATEVVFPGDHLLCFATDAQIERFKADIAAEEQSQKNAAGLESYDLRKFKVGSDSKLENVSILKSGIREQFDCMVVGIERDSKRMTSPTSELTMRENDILWIVGDDMKLRELSALFGH